MSLLDYLRNNNQFIQSQSDNEYNGRNELNIFFKRWYILYFNYRKKYSFFRITILEK